VYLLCPELSELGVGDRSGCPGGGAAVLTWCCRERSWTSNALLPGAAQLPLSAYRQDCKNLAWHFSIFPIQRGFPEKRPGKRVLEAMQASALSVQV